MSKTSFKTFCIEYYARYAGIEGVDAYRLFAESDLLKVLDDETGLYGMSALYIAGCCIAEGTWAEIRHLGAA